MLKKREEKYLAAKDKEWEEINHGFNHFCSGVWKELRRDVKEQFVCMMYYKRPNNKYDRFAHAVEWWFKIGIIFFAFKGFTFWLTGR
jgi:hypothetical protein